MPIDFHSRENRFTYADRSADTSWKDAMRGLLDPTGLEVADVGCGGGVYSHAWLDLGADAVTGIDFSDEMLTAAGAGASNRPGLSFRRGEATATRLDDASVDVVFERALAHHVPDLEALTREARRILREDGVVIIQDRVADDTLEPASAEHLRGYLFECSPRLLEIDLARRPDRERLVAALAAAGFEEITTSRFWEVRRVYADPREYLDEIRTRKGRSILYELDEEELASLTACLSERIPAGAPLVEKDPWTIWSGHAP